MLFSKIARTITKSPARLNSRGLASGLPKFDEFSKITMKQLWPAVVVILGNRKKLFDVILHKKCFSRNLWRLLHSEPFGNDVYGTKQMDETIDEDLHCTFCISSFKVKVLN